MTPPAKALFITEESPYPPTSGGKIRDYCMLEVLREKFEIEILTFSANKRVALPSGVSISVLPRPSSFSLSRILSPFRPYVLNGYSKAMENAIKEKGETGMLLWASRLTMGKYLSKGASLGLIGVLDEHNIESHLIQKILDQKAHSNLERMKLQLLRNAEIQFCEAAKAVAVTSIVDQEILKGFLKTPLKQKAPTPSIHIFPNTIDAEPYRSIRDEHGEGLLFTGTLDYFPNIEGLGWFIHHVIPKFGNQKLQITVAGASPSPSFSEEIRNAGIELYENPPSILPYFKKASIFLAPLLSGSGTRLKIIEAMCAGKAVVSTSKGAEGLNIVSGKDLLIADTPSGFAEAILKLASDSNYRNTISRNAVLNAEKNYDWKVLRSCLEGLLKDLEITGGRE